MTLEAQMKFLAAYFPSEQQAAVFESIKTIITMAKAEERKRILDTLPKDQTQEDVPEDETYNLGFNNALKQVRAIISNQPEGK